MKKLFLSILILFCSVFYLHAETTPNAFETYELIVTSTAQIHSNTEKLIAQLNEKSAVYPEFKTLEKIYSLMALLKDKKNEGDLSEYADYLKLRTELLNDKALLKEARTLMDVIDLKYLYLIKDYKNLLDRLAKYPKNSIFLAEPMLMGFKIYYPDCLSQNNNITLNDLTKKIKEISRLVKSINESSASFDELEKLFSGPSEFETKRDAVYSETLFKNYEFIFSQTIQMVSADECGFSATPNLVPSAFQFLNEHKLASKLFIEKIGDDENKLIRALKLRYYETVDTKPENLKELYKKFAIKNLEKPSRGIEFENDLKSPLKKLAGQDVLRLLCKMKCGFGDCTYACADDTLNAFVGEVKMDTALYDDIANNFYSTSSTMGKSFVFAGLPSAQFSGAMAVFKLTNQELKFIGIYHVNYGAGCD